MISQHDLSFLLQDLATSFHHGRQVAILNHRSFGGREEI